MYLYVSVSYRMKKRERSSSNLEAVGDARLRR